MNDLDYENTPMEFISSSGTLLANEDGTINKHSDFDKDSWLSEISKVDIEELNNYYKIQHLGLCEGGDVLDFGWWDKKGNYNKPKKSWRLETFHKTSLTEKEIQTTLADSYKWIRDNRS